MGGEEGGRKLSMKTSQTRGNTGAQCQDTFSLQLCGTKYSHYSVGDI